MSFNDNLKEAWALTKKNIDELQEKLALIPHFCDCPDCEQPSNGEGKAMRSNLKALINDKKSMENYAKSNNITLE